MFTDETAIQIGSSGREWCILQPGTAHLPQHLSTVFRRGSTLHIWGAIYHGVKLPLYRFDLAKARTVNGKKVCSQMITAEVYAGQVLAGPTEAYINQLWEAGHEVHVMEDGAPVHTARYVQTARALTAFPSAFHPPASPDLNPIENCWAVLKQRLHKLPTHPTSLDELWQAVTKLWDEMPQSILDNPIDDMPRRRRDPRRAKGGAVLA